MAGAKRTANVADKYNLTEAEADWVDRQVDAGADVKDAVLSIRSQRVGPASLPEFRPLSDEAAGELGVAEEEFRPITSDDLEHDDSAPMPAFTGTQEEGDAEAVTGLVDWAENAVAAGEFATVDDALLAIVEVADAIAEAEGYVPGEERT
jgi:hypothetical protein